MANKPKVPVDSEALAEIILAQCTHPEDGALGDLLRECLRRNGDAVRAVIGRPDVQLALALRISTTEEKWHAVTAMMLCTLRHADRTAAAAIAAECDVTALARSLSYLMDYSAQQVILLARLYACNPRVGAKVFDRCGELLKDFLAQSSFPYLDLPEGLVADVEHWRDCG